MKVAYLLLVLVFSTATSMALAEKVYKTVDANGRVSFTNKPPPDAIIKQQETVEIRESTSNRTEAVQVGTDWYCGRLQLPSFDTGRSEATFYEQVASKKREWLRRVKEHDRNLLSSQKRTAARYSNAASTYETPENLAAAQDWRCGITWAGKQEASLSERQHELEQSILLEEAKLNELNAVLDRTCGVRPAYSLDRVEKAAALLDRQDKWDTCAKSHLTVVNQVKSNLEEQNSQLSLLHKIRLQFNNLDT